LFSATVHLQQCCQLVEIYIKNPTLLTEIYFFSPDQMITEVNFHTKFNFLSFSIFLKGINFLNYQFHYLKFNFSHVWDPGSGKKSSRILILGVKSTGSWIWISNTAYVCGRIALPAVEFSVYMAEINCQELATVISSG
jgi:hypothetical protein